MKLWNFIKENMLKNPGQGISENEKSLSFEEALLRAEEFAGELRGTACCAVLCASEMSAAVALLACFAAGVTALPLSAAYGEAHWGKIVDSVSPDGIVTDDDGRLALNKRQGSRYAAPKVHPALIMCTSGTSGKPKGAMLSEHNIITNVSDIAAYFAMGREDTVLIARPLYHCAVLVGEFLTALVKGAGVRFCSVQPCGRAGADQDLWDFRFLRHADAAFSHGKVQPRESCRVAEAYRDQRGMHGRRNRTEDPRGISGVQHLSCVRTYRGVPACKLSAARIL